MKTITSGDIHGNQCWETINPHDYDLIVFVGDYTDHWTRPDTQIVSNLQKIVELKKQYLDKVILLYGNHDLAYVYPGIRVWACSGFRSSIATVLHNIFKENHYLFQVAHQVGNHLWSHAGITKAWYDTKLVYTLNAFTERFPEFSSVSLAEKLNLLMQTSYVNSLADCGHLRGGSSPWGGLFWADYDEHTPENLLEGYHQITGHNRVTSIHTKGDSNSSITFTDVLDTEARFYEKEI